MTAAVSSAGSRVASVLGGSFLRVAVAFVTATAVTAAVAGPMAYQAHEARQRTDDLAAAARETQEEGVGGGGEGTVTTSTTASSTTTTSTSAPTTASTTVPTSSPTSPRSTGATTTVPPGTTAPVQATAPPPPPATLPTVPGVPTVPTVPTVPPTTLPPTEPSGITFVRILGGLAIDLRGATLRGSVIIGLDPLTFPVVRAVRFYLDDDTNPTAHEVGWTLDTLALVNGSIHTVRAIVTVTTASVIETSAAFTVNNG